MVEKVTDPSKIVTDELVLKRLAEQGIDKDYVEFWHDYAPRSLGKEYSPYAKFYRDLKSGKKFMVVSGLPMVKPGGQKIEVGWDKRGNRYISKANLFSAIVEGKQVKLFCLSNQPDGTRKGEQVIYKPQLFIDGAEILNGEQPTLLPTDPVNENYQENTLEWTYGTVCKRRIRIIEGRFRERWLFGSNPNSSVRIKHNFVGSLKLKLGYARDIEGNPLKVSVIGDEEIVEASEFDNAIYPVEIGATLTVYPDTDAAGVDGYVDNANNPPNATWTVIVGAAGSYSDDSGDWARCTYITSSIVENRWSQNCRGIHVFPTSGIPDAATISAAVLSLYGIAANKRDDLSIAPDVNIYSSAPASNTALVAGDFDSLGTTAFSTAITYAGWAEGAYNDFTLNVAGRATISKTGVSPFGTRNANYDVAEELDPGNHAPAWSSANNSHMSTWCSEKGAGFKPKLVVTYYVVPRHGFVNFQGPGIV